MPPPENNIRTGSDDREDSQPPPLPKKFWKTFLEKMAISARLMGKEIHRKKLRWFDLRRANYRLGKKAYESQLASPEDNRIIDRLNKIQDRIGALRQPVNSGSSFSERAKAVAKGGARFMKIQILKSKRAHAFRMLGAQTPQEQPSDASLASEIEQARAASNRIQTLDVEIGILAAQTYPWARRPLLAVAILSLALVAVMATEVSKTTPTNAKELFAQGCNKIKNGDLDGAIADFNRAIEIDPKFANAYANLSGVKLAKGDLNGAISDSTRSIELDPNGPSASTAHSNRGKAKERQKDFKGALADYDRCIELDPKSADAYFQRGNVKVQTSADWTGAAQDYSYAIKLDPKMAMAYFNRAITEEATHNPDAAIADYGRAIELDPANASIYLRRANLRHAKGDLAGAKADLDRGNALSNAQNKEPEAVAAGDAKAWANSYRNAKFITRAEFLRNTGPVRLVVRERSGVRECVPNLEQIVRTSATAKGWTLAATSTDVELVVDADIDRAKITTTEHTTFGSVESGYHMAFIVAVQVGFRMKVNCRRGDKFVQLDAYPSRSWETYYYYMGDLVDFEAAYAKGCRQALDWAFESISEIRDADDVDDQAAWSASLWPASQDAQMHKSFVSPLTSEPGAARHSFYGVTTFDADVELLDKAAKDFKSDSLQQSWMAELNRNGQQVDSSSDVRILHQFAAFGLSRGWLPGGPVCYFDLSAIRVWQKNVVFPFNGELRRGKVCIWSDVTTATALPGDHSNTARDLMNRSIRSAAIEFALRR